MRLIRKPGKSHRVSIRTTQDQWIAFPRRADDKGWITLSDVDVVLAVSVDDVAAPSAARVHWIGADDMRTRFDKAYKVRRTAGHTLHLGRGIWIPLYIPDDGTPRLAGGGAGLDHPEIARVPLANGVGAQQVDEPGRAPARSAVRTSESGSSEDGPLTIPEAKRRLAATLGVSEASIKITIEG